MLKELGVAYGSFSHLPREACIGATLVGTAVVNNVPAVPEVLISFLIINLHLSGQVIKDMDVALKSEPICILFAEQKGKCGEFSRTEVVWNHSIPI
jgi:hypothetical protein